MKVNSLHYSQTQEFWRENSNFLFYKSPLQTFAVFAIFALAAQAKADGPGPHHAHAPHHAPHHDVPVHYAYEYKVHDDYAGTDFGHHEARDGYATNGEYHVLLPDGRLQTVTYHVDDAYGGYIADVKYTGTAHPHPHHAKAHPQPTYHAAPHHI